MQNRRHFLKTGLSMAAAGLPVAAPLVGAGRSVAEEAPPETTSLRLIQYPATCLAPLDILDDLLGDEGFADVRYVPNPGTSGPMFARREADIAQDFCAFVTAEIDADEPIITLAGVHPGCFELVARESIRSVVDLKARNVGVHGTGANSDHGMLSIIVASVGLDPAKDINWIPFGSGDPKDLLADDKIDAFMTFPPWAQEMRALRTGHVILNSSADRPWSQYFCCMLIGNAEFVRHNPIATKRVVRAMIRANDICAAKPDWVARRLVDRGFAPRYESVRQGLDDVSYRNWRDYDAEDSVRFWALRQRELGMIKSSPDKIIATGTDWRFVREVRKELGI
jgi:NitT/TauT family transport system substrate-binding protein